VLGTDFYVRGLFSAFVERQRAPVSEPASLKVSNQNRPRPRISRGKSARPARAGSSGGQAAIRLLQEITSPDRTASSTQQWCAMGTASPEYFVLTTRHES